MRTKEKDNGIVLLKLSLYCISLWILMFMLIVLKIDVSMLSGKIEWNTLKDFICANVFSVICICIILIGLMGYAYFKDYLKNAKKLPVEIEECESVNYENLSFLATYVIPLVCFPMKTDREIFVLFAVIVIIGCIFVKTNLYYRNLLGGLYRENPVKSRNYEAVKSSKKWENVGNSYIIPALLLYRYSYI